MKFFEYLDRKYRNPRNVYDTNHIGLIALKYMGILPIKYDAETSRIINLSKSGQFVSILLTIAYIIGMIDQLTKKSIIANQFSNIDKSLVYVGMLLPFCTGFITISLIYGSSRKIINTIKCTLKILSMIDAKLVEHDVNLMNRQMIQNHIFISIFGFLNGIVILSYFVERNITYSGLGGLILCFLYIIPYIYINVIMYLYISFIFMHRQRFGYIHLYLKKIFNIPNNSFNRKVFYKVSKKYFLYKMKSSEIKSSNSCEYEMKVLLDFHFTLWDLLEFINENFGYLMSICIAAMFLNDILYIFMALKMIEYYDYSLKESLFLGYWITISKVITTYLPFECERCRKEVNYTIKQYN